VGEMLKSAVRRPHPIGSRIEVLCVLIFVVDAVDDSTRSCLFRMYGLLVLVFLYNFPTIIKEYIVLE
jgi:hypothetical protein